MKVSGSTASLVRGVSQQVPQDRQPGQHTEQVNMLPDPVEGLVRRHGSQWVAEKHMAALSPAKAAAYLQDTAGYRTFEYSNGGKDFVLLVRQATRAEGSDLPPMFVYNRTDRTFLDLIRPTVDPVLDTFEAGGCSGITSIGKYVFMAGQDIVPAATTTDVWGTADNQRHAALWVRGGAYSREFKVTATLTDDSKISFSHKTPTSSYGGTLDTSGVSPYIIDPAGISTTPGTGPAVVTKTQGAAGPLAASQTITCGLGSGETFQRVSSVTTTDVNRWEGESGEIRWNLQTFTLKAGVDYVVVGNVVTLLKAQQPMLPGNDVPPAGHIPVPGQVVVTYTVTTSGVAPQVTYIKDDATEQAYIKRGDTYGVTTLIYGKFQPEGLKVTRQGQELSNVAPAMPTTANQYSWVAGTDTVYFVQALANDPNVSMTYKKIKTLANPNYSAVVADITNEYNTAVTKWIGYAAAEIAPEQIALRLLDAAKLAGLNTATRVGSTVVFDNVKALVVDDGGDGALVRATANEIAAAEDVTKVHRIGKVVKVRSRSSAEAYYLKATSTDPQVTSGWADVTWVEGAGVVHSIQSGLIYGTASGTSFYVASTAALLNGILPGNHPEYKPSTVGDGDTSPMPFYIGRKITYLGVFQDRLLIGAGAVVRASKTGEYLNFFRSSVLTVPQDDPIEMLSQGSEDDVLRHSVIYDRDLVIFADKRQYAISGRSALSPTGANMAVMSSHADAATSPPLAVGGLIFYGKVGSNSSALHQIQPGQVAESPESYDVSSQVSTYLKGAVIEVCNHAKPTHLFLRTTGHRHGFYVFTYLDKEGAGRQQDAWHRWEYDVALGPLVGISRTKDGPMLYTLRVAHGKVWIVADQQPMVAGLSSTPYLDSQRPWSQVANGTSLQPDGEPGWFTAFDQSSDWYLIGDTLAATPTLLADYPQATGPRTGRGFVSSFTPTNPYVRDRNDRPILTGRLTVTKLMTAWAKSSGFFTDLTARRQSSSKEYNARILGDPVDVVGREVVTEFNQSVPLGYETRDYSLTLRSRRWYPFTLTGLEWVGQFFNTTQRL